MREILFRGKRIDNGEWVEGLLWKKKYDTPKLFMSYFPNKDDDEDVVVIDPETVGEYTGITYKNGKKIFEGDIIRNNGNEIGVIRHCKYDVYSHYVFGGYCCVDKTSALIDWTSCWRCEVIGNIHDNPELLQK